MYIILILYIYNFFCLEVYMKPKSSECTKLYHELASWRDEEICYGNMEKAKKVQKIIEMIIKRNNAIY